MKKVFSLLPLGCFWIVYFTLSLYFRYNSYSIMWEYALEHTVRSYIHVIVMHMAFTIFLAAIGCTFLRKYKLLAVYSLIGIDLILVFFMIIKLFKLYRPIDLAQIFEASRIAICGILMIVAYFVTLLCLIINIIQNLIHKPTTTKQNENDE